MALPLQPIGWSHEHGDLPGTLSLDAEFLAIGWVALGASVAAAGQKRLLILNSHGGNPPPIALAAMRLRAEHGLLVVQTHWEALAEPAALAPPGAPARDWHAGWIETSVMLHLRPDLVALEKAARREMRFPEGLPPDGPAPWAWMATDLNPSGVIGDPLLASAALGSQLVERAAAGLGRAHRPHGRGALAAIGSGLESHPFSRRLGRRLRGKIVQPAQLRGGCIFIGDRAETQPAASTAPSIAPP